MQRSWHWGVRVVDDRERLGEVYDWSSKLCNGDRQKWMPKAESYLEVTEDLIRDVVIRGSKSTLEPINGDIADTITDWTHRLWRLVL